MKFNWKGLKSNAFVDGVIDAEDKDEALFTLKQDGVIVTEVTEAEPQAKKKVKGKREFKASSKLKIDDKELLLFSRKLTTMMKAGLAIVPALKMLKQQSENPKFIPVMDDLLKKINSGITLSEAFESYPTLFDVVYINLIKAGEASGNLDTFLDRICINLEKTIKIKKAIKSAMMYPIILLTVAISVVGVMMIFVVPVFVEIFGNANIELPGPTKVVMAMSDFLRSWTAPIIIGLVYVVFRFLKSVVRKNDKLQQGFDKKLMTLPVIGNLVRDATMARFSMVLSNLIAGGVNLIEATEITKNSITNSRIKASIERVKREIFSGRPFSVALRETEDFPETMCGFIEVGEETGKLNDMLTTVSLYYEGEFDSSVESFSSMLEPIMIVFLGVVIGFILVAMYQPIFLMGSAV
ncbi:type II secretion system F family protein [Nitrosomonadales bacterium]|jgi:type IV pilus assembly protein PilC|nr:type II secretion system F family protein [Nitrosomonadales bacterium]